MPGRPRGRPFVENANGAPLERFARFCRFDPLTGCVIWIGGTTAGRGHSARYGSFWFEGRRWFAHRWSAKHIHGLEIDGLQIDHCCPLLKHPNTLCVEHVQAIPAAVNRELQWLRVQVGLDEAPPAAAPHNGLIDCGRAPPAWLDPVAAALADAAVPF